CRRTANETGETNKERKHGKQLQSKTGNKELIHKTKTEHGKVHSRNKVLAKRGNKGRIMTFQLLWM
ncbi:hypothetical protein DVA76_18525, partial [Acinetobacter baumannii]